VLLSFPSLCCRQSEASPAGTSPVKDLRPTWRRLSGPPDSCRWIVDRWITGNGWQMTLGGFQMDSSNLCQLWLFIIIVLCCNWVISLNEHNIKWIRMFGPYSIPAAFTPGTSCRWERCGRHLPYTRGSQDGRNPECRSPVNTYTDICTHVMYGYCMVWLNVLVIGYLQYLRLQLF